MTIEFKTFGEKNNQALVLIHPFPFDSRLWSQVAQQLAGNYFVITPDLRGCGQSELGNDEPSMDRLALDVIELIDSLSIAKAVFGGISLGGYVVMSLARLAPDLFDGLILVDTKASADNDAAKENRIRVANQMKENGKVGLFAQQMLPNVIGEYTHANRPEVVEQVETWMVEAHAQTIAWLQLAMANRPNSFDVLAKLDVPALLIRGDQDLISSESDFDEMEKYLRQVTNIQIKNAGHLPPVEDPEATAQAIANWLATFKEN